MKRKMKILIIWMSDLAVCRSVLTLPFPIRAGGLRASIDIFSQDVETAKKYLIAHMKSV